MEVLLVVVGVAIGAGIGWRLGRPGRARVPATTAEVPQPNVPSFDEVVDDHPSGVVIADARGTVTYRNRSARAMAGTHVGVLLDEAIERHVERGNAGESSHEVLEFHGPPRTVLVVVARPLASAGSVVFIEDISEQRRTDKIRTDFVANLSHELKTPIGAMSVLAETLLDEEDPATVRRVAGRMMSEAQRATRTLDDLMELSRIELGGERVDEPVRVSEVVRAGVERVTELAAQRQIAIALPDPADAAHRCDGFVVRGDRRQLNSAVGNLVENAVKYAAPGTPVEIEVHRAGDSVEIAVVDRGPGIPQRDLDRIFERFYRVDRARSRETGGTGLGLSIVRHVAANHGGEIRVTSTEGEGSTFVLRLPAEVGAEIEPAEQRSEGVA